MSEQSDFDAALRRLKAEIDSERRDEHLAKAQKESESFYQWLSRGLAAFIGFMLGLVVAINVQDCSDLRHRVSVLESKIK
jgi:hypothetical protein